jgi:hypothetical protein
MKVAELVSLMANKLAYLNTAKSTAMAAGDLETIIKLDVEIQETQATLTTLRSVS